MNLEFEEAAAVDLARRIRKSCDKCISQIASCKKERQKYSAIFAVCFLLLYAVASYRLEIGLAAFNLSCAFGFPSLWWWVFSDAIKARRILKREFSAQERRVKELIAEIQKHQ